MLCMLRASNSRGAIVDDVMLLSYALNPTHTTQTLADVAARNGHAPPASLTSAAAIVHALVPALRTACRREQGHQRLHRYRSASCSGALPHGRGRRSNRQAGSELGSLHASAPRSSGVGERIFELAGQRFNINSPKQLGVVLFTHMGLPAPVKYGKGKTISTAQDVLETLAEKHEVPRLVLEYRHVSKLKSTYIDQLPLLADADSRVHTTFQAAATSTGRLSSVNPNLQNIPIRTELGREIRAAFTSAPGTAASLRRLLADRAAAAGALQQRSAARARLPDQRGHSHAHRQRGLRRACRIDGQGDARARQGGQLRYRLWHFAVRAGRAAWHSAGRGARLHRSLFRALPGRAGLH